MRRIILISLVWGLAVVAHADEIGVALSDTPAAVQKTIQAQASDGTIGDITKSADDEDTVYDIDLTAKDGSDRDFSVAQDGTLLSVEVPLSETPDAVQKMIQAQVSAIDSIDKNLAEEEISFDVKGTGDDKKEKNFTVSDDGTLLGEEVALDETPEAVQKAIASQLGGGKLESIDENFDDDGTNFDVEATFPGGAKTSFNVTIDGSLASKEVPLSEVPPGARKAIENRIGDGTVLRVDKSFIKRMGVEPFEVEGRKDGKPFDFSVGPRGRFLGMDY